MLYYIHHWSTSTIVAISKYNTYLIYLKINKKHNLMLILWLKCMLSLFYPKKLVKQIRRMRTVLYTVSHVHVSERIHASTWLANDRWGIGRGFKKPK